MTTAAAAEYPSSSEFNVLVQRFKLLNLVQRVAHSDVSEMLDTVGLEGLSRKGTLSQWAWDDKDGSGSSALSDDDDRVNGRTGRAYHVGDAGLFRSGPRRVAGATSAATRRSEQVRPPLTTRTTGPPTVVAARPRSPPRMNFGRPTSSFEARVAAARWNSGVEAETDPSSVERAYAGTSARLRHTTPPLPSEAAPPASDTRRRYVVRRTHRVVRRSPEERETFYARLAEPRVRPSAAAEDVLVYDDAAEGRLPAAPSQPLAPLSDTRDAAATRDGLYSRRTLPGARAADTVEGYAPAPYAPPAPLSGAGAVPLYHQQQRRPSLDAYYAYPRHPAPAPLSPHNDQQLLQHMSASFFSPTAAAPWAADPNAVSGSASGGGVRDYPYDWVEGEGGGREARHTPPPPPLHSATSGLMRRRTVNFVTPQGGDAAGERQPETEQAPLQVHAATSPGEDHYSSPLSPEEVPSSAASPPPVTLPRSEITGPPNRDRGGAAGGGPDGAARSAPPVPRLQLPLRRGSSGAADLLEQEDAAASSQHASSGNSHNLSSQPLQKSPRVARGLAPKAKPKAALVSPRIPLEAVRHAAALVSRSDSILLNPTSLNSGGSAQHSYSGTGASPLQCSPEHQQRQQQPPHQRSSSARTEPAAQSFGGRGVLRSPRPRPHTVMVTTGAGAAAVAAAARDESSDEEIGAQDATSAPRSRSGAGAAGSDAPSSAAAAPHLDARASAAAKQSFVELSSAIDHMLRDHQQLLRQVYKDTGAVERATPSAVAATKRSAAVAVASSASSRPVRGPAGDSSYGSSSFEDDSDSRRADGARGGAAGYTIEVDLGSADDDDDDDGIGDNVDLFGAPDREAGGDVEDEMLLYTRLQHQLTRLDADMVRLGLENSSEGNASAVSGESSTTALASGGAADAAARVPPRAAAAPAAPPRQRRRGEMEEEVVQRLCAYRMDHFQYVAYNERLWNTSSTSQFTFAQRLTAAMTEECWAEVMAEVGSIMDEYVDGLADHELQ